MYEMLRHLSEFSHDLLHCPMFGSVPDESLRYFSPALASHWTSEPTVTHMARFSGASANAMIGCYHPCHTLSPPIVYILVGAHRVHTYLLPLLELSMISCLFDYQSMSLKANRAWNIHVRAARVACLAVNIHVRFVIASVTVAVIVGSMPIILFISLTTQSHIEHSRTTGTRMDTRFVC